MMKKSFELSFKLEPKGIQDKLFQTPRFASFNHAIDTICRIGVPCKKTNVYNDISYRCVALSKFQLTG